MESSIATNGTARAVETTRAYVIFTNSPGK